MTLIGAVSRKGVFAVDVLLQGSFGCPQGRPDKRYLTLASWCLKVSLRVGFKIDMKDLNTKIYIGLKKTYCLAKPHPWVAQQGDDPK